MGSLDLRSGTELALVAYVLLLAGLAAKIGWAPVHNWLPDAHSEAPAPVSALLSAALLPACSSSRGAHEQALAPTSAPGRPAGARRLRPRLTRGCRSVSLARHAWKRLLAYSSLEHMGVIALGIGFGDAAWVAGVAVHMPATRSPRRSASTPPRRCSGTSHGPRATRSPASPDPADARHDDGISLGALAGLPPSPLFVSEVLIVAGGFQAGTCLGGRGRRPSCSRSGSSGSSHALVETTSGGRARSAARAPGSGASSPHRGLGLALLLALAAAAPGCRDGDRRRPRARGSRDDLAPAPTVRPSRPRSPTACGSPGCTRPRTAPSYERCSSRPTARLRLETVGAGGRCRSIVDLAPAAGWDEREAHDLYGIRFDGHEPLRPLVDHDRPRTLTVPVRGDDPYQVAVGPIHAGVIESGHFRFHVVGDRILHLDARLFYKHRGLERAAEGQTLDEGLAYAARACAACAVTNAVAYAQACEDALGLVADPELARVRTILLELERVWSHLNDIAAVCAGVGLAAGNNRFAALTERARRLNAALTGHRFLFGSVAVGGSDLDARRDGRAPRAHELAAHRREAARPGANSSSTPRSRIGSPTSASSTAGDALRLGAVGPARAGGGHRRGRRATPARGSPTRGSSPPPRAPPATSRRGSSSARSSCAQSFDLLDRAARPARRARRLQPSGGAERAIGVGRVESPRGATSCIVERDGDRVDAAPAAHRLLRELARRRARGGRQPAPRLPADQQELRALLRLRRPLMLTLLRDLRRLRREIALPAPGRGRSLAIRHVDAGSCNGCEHELTLAQAPTTTSQRFGLGIVASPRHADVLLITGAVTTRMHEPLLTAYEAMPEPRRVAALGDCALGCNLLGNRRANSSAPSRRPPRRPPHPRLPTHPRRDRRGAARA